MATTIALSTDALARARRGDHDLLASEVATVGPGVPDDLAASLATTRVVARCLLAAPDGLRRLDLHAGAGIALLLDGDGGDSTRPSHGLVSNHLDALVHLVVESVGLQWRPTPTPAAFSVDDPTDVPTSILEYPGSILADRLPPTVDPTRLRWWSLQFPGDQSVVAHELTVLDAHRGGLFLQRGSRLEPTSSADTWRRLWANLAS